MPKRRHLIAWGRATRALGLDREPLAASFVALGSDVARLLDSAADDRAFMSALRLHQANLKLLPRWGAIAELKRLERLAAPAETEPETASNVAEPLARVNVLAELRARKAAHD